MQSSLTFNNLLVCALENDLQNWSYCQHTGGERRLEKKTMMMTRFRSRPTCHANERTRVSSLNRGGIRLGNWTSCDATWDLRVITVTRVHCEDNQEIHLLLHIGLKLHGHRTEESPESMTKSLRCSKSLLIDNFNPWTVLPSLSSS